ncbi:MAG: DUF2537 domain-containing protein [Corynebacteriales bacterium]|nr:DUF2537 domain-containing protein [Mycobacteriales bacterium]
MSSAEPTPWALGLTLAAVSALVVTGAVLGVYSVIAETGRLLAVFGVVVVCGGIAPSAWVWRRRSVLRWMGGGALIGLVIGLLVAVGYAATR